MTFEEVIARDGKLVYTNVGDSMYPLIQPRDLLVIRAVKQPPKINDIPLYKRDNGQYVLHRIVDIENGEYVMRGDNRDFYEHGITDRHIIGMLTDIVRDGKTIPVDDVLRQYRVRVAFDLLYLVGCALKGEAPQKERVEKMDLLAVFRLSQAHFLTVAAACALEQVMAVLPGNFREEKGKIIRKLSMLEIECSKVMQALDEANIRCLPLKGIVLKSFYPKTSMRDMSDNDFLCDKSKMNEVKAVMERLGFSCTMFGKFNHDVYEKPPYLVFEMHHALFDGEREALENAFFGDIGDRLVSADGAFGMTHEDLYLYVVAHIRKHYEFAGTGLRALTDVFVLDRAFGASFDSDRLRSGLERLQMTEFEHDIRTLAQKVFSEEPLSEKEREMLDYLVRSGGYGFAEQARHNAIARSLGDDDSGRAKQRYVMNRFFIRGETLEKLYPTVAKHKILYPLLVVYRPIKGVVKRRKGLARELRSLKAYKSKK